MKKTTESRYIHVCYLCNVELDKYHLPFFQSICEFCVLYLEELLAGCPALRRSCSSGQSVENKWKRRGIKQLFSWISLMSLGMNLFFWTCLASFIGSIWIFWLSTKNMKFVDTDSRKKTLVIFTIGCYFHNTLTNTLLVLIFARTNFRAISRSGPKMREI